jgi:putative acetyltransferase
MASVIIRAERAEDFEAVGALIDVAFAPMAFASGTEAAIVVALREAGAVTVGLVAEDRGEIVGQATFSPVTINGLPSRWHALGPIAVAPGRQGQGIGVALIEHGLAELRAMGAAGCVLTGSGYYRRFGFANSTRMRVEGYPPEDFLVLAFGEDAEGAVGFHQAFG